jgi:hypothetical protein
MLSVMRELVASVIGVALRAFGRDVGRMVPH